MENKSEIVYQSIQDALKNPFAVRKIDIKNREGAEHPMPKEIRNLKNLQSYIISCSLPEFAEIPDEIGHLQQLEELYLAYTNINKISPEIARLKKLKSLHIHSKIKQLPNEILEMENLEKLSIRGDEIESLPEKIDSLKNLQKLDLTLCKNLSTLPDSIGALKNLTTINLNSTAIKNIPKSLKHLERLSFLSFQSCSINLNLEEILNLLGDLPNLRHLNLASCSIETLPKTIGKLKQLEFLDLGHNYYLEDIPDEITNLNNWKTIRISSLCTNAKKKIRKLLKGGKLITQWKYEGDSGYMLEDRETQRYICKSAVIVWNGQKVIEFL